MAGLGGLGGLEEGWEPGSLGKEAPGSLGEAWGNPLVG